MHPPSMITTTSSSLVLLIKSCMDFCLPLWHPPPCYHSAYIFLSFFCLKEFMSTSSSRYRLPGIAHKLVHISAFYIKPFQPHLFLQHRHTGEANFKNAHCFLASYFCTCSLLSALKVSFLFSNSNIHGGCLSNPLICIKCSPYDFF